jgi:hypothetical protein
MNDVGLIGLDYLWRVILFGSDPVAEKYELNHYSFLINLTFVCPFECFVI